MEREWFRMAGSRRKIADGDSFIMLSWENYTHFMIPSASGEESPWLALKSSTGA
jgi:hypothetical protein